MARWFLAEAAAQDLDRLTDFLLERQPEHAAQTVDLITDALQILEAHPRIGRPLGHALRELVISRGQTGYVALYEYDELADVALVLAVRPDCSQALDITGVAPEAESRHGTSVGIGLSGTA